MKGNLKLCSSSKRLLYIPLFMVLCGSISSAQSPNPFTSPQDQELKISDLLKLPGKIVGEGTNTRVTGKFKVATYRLEEVALPRAMEVKIHEQNVQVNRAFRLTVTGGPFLVRALPPVIWIGDTAVGYGVESEELDAITAITFDSSLLREGAIIYLSYGDKEKKEDRDALPEKLQLMKAKGRE